MPDRDDMADNSKPTLRDIYEAVDGLRNDIASKYVTKDAFEPVKNIVYGLVGVVLLVVIGAVVGLVVKASTEPTVPKTTVEVNPIDEGAK